MQRRLQFRQCPPKPWSEAVAVQGVEPIPLLVVMDLCGYARQAIWIERLVVLFLLLLHVFNLARNVPFMQTVRGGGQGVSRLACQAVRRRFGSVLSLTSSLTSEAKLPASMKGGHNDSVSKALRCNPHLPDWKRPCGRSGLDNTVPPVARCRGLFDV
jgi:hypothetical protein